MKFNNVFRRENGKYVYYLADKAIYKTDVPNFIYDIGSDTHILIKHGPEQHMKDWLRHAREKCEDQGLDVNEHFGFQRFELRGVSEEELNKMVNNTGYLPKDLKELIRGA